MTVRLKFDIDLRLPKRLANCKSFTQSCSEHPLCDFSCCYKIVLYKEISSCV